MNYKSTNMTKDRHIFTCCITYNHNRHKGRKQKRKRKKKTPNHHTVPLPFALKSILRQPKKFENSNILPCKNIIFKNILSNKIKIIQDFITP
jgi:hypothetical protein